MHKKYSLHSNQACLCFRLMMYCYCFFRTHRNKKWNCLIEHKSNMWQDGEGTLIIVLRDCFCLFCTRLKPSEISIFISFCRAILSAVKGLKVRNNSLVFVCLRFSNHLIDSQVSKTASVADLFLQSLSASCQFSFEVKTPKHVPENGLNWVKSAAHCKTCGAVVVGGGIVVVVNGCVVPVIDQMFAYITTMCVCI